MKTLPIKTLTIAAISGLVLAACATATPYAPAGMNGKRGGYAEQRLETNRYRVTFAGNSVTSREQVEMSLLLRSAELTVESGFDWFATVNRATDRDSRLQSLGASPMSRLYSPWSYNAYWGPTWRFQRRGYWSAWDPFWGNDFDVRQVDRYEASAEIVMGRGAKPADDSNAFNAREVVENLAPRVIRPDS